jgi:hypothetical protein
MREETMNDNWFVITPSSYSEEELRRLYGEDAVVSSVGRFNLVHLDSPHPEEIERRIAEFDLNDLFDADCPICQMLRLQGGEGVCDDGSDSQH